MTVSALRRPERFAGAFLALLVQAGFLALLILSRPSIEVPKTLARELTFILPPLSRVLPPPAPAAGRRLPRLQAPAPAVAPDEAPHDRLYALPPGAPDLSGLGKSIFGCALENWSSLTPEQRARCPRPGENFAILEAPNLMGSRSHVKDETHWEEEWAREQSPVLLPCGGFVNIICLLTKIANGTLGDYADPKTWPHYAVVQLPKEDFYKAEQAYQAWHRDHPSPEGVGVHPQ